MRTHNLIAIKKLGHTITFTSVASVSMRSVQLNYYYYLNLVEKSQLQWIRSINFYTVWQLWNDVNVRSLQLKLKPTNCGAFIPVIFIHNEFCLFVSSLFFCFFLYCVRIQWPKLFPMLWCNGKLKICINSMVKRSAYYL